MKIRRIVSPEDKEVEDKKRKNRNKYLGILLLVIMAISSLGYAFISSDKTENGDSSREGIFEENGQWIARYGDLQLVFYTSPDEAKNVSSNINITLNEFSKSNVYVADKEKVLGGFLVQSIGKYVSLSDACYGSCEEDLPEKNCSGSDYLIIWNRNESNSLNQNGKCIFINGDIKSVDAFVYRVFGLI